MTVGGAVSAPDPWCRADRHGTRAARSTHGCTCQVTRDLEARYERGRQWDQLQGRPRRVPAVGTVRRLRALARLGWSSTAIAEQMGVTRGSVRQMQRAGKWVNRSTHEAVVAAYDALSMRLPPDSRTARQVRSHAQRRHWPPPLAWDDDTIDDLDAEPMGGVRGPADPREQQQAVDMVVVWRLVDHGQRARKLTTAEAALAVRLLRQRGVNERQIEKTYGLKAERYREESA